MRKTVINTPNSRNLEKQGKIIIDIRLLNDSGSFFFKTGITLVIIILS